jgi:nucleotide-binding universal stress UspA family protein
MRIPVRSETDALYVTCGVAALIAASVILGALVDPIAGLALFAGGVAGAVFWELGTEDPDRARPLREALSEGPGGSLATRRRVLVVANRTLAGEELRETLRRAAADGAELHVVAPILPSRVHYIASDVDRELAEARERLAAALAWARDEGLDADGKVGDPFTAFGAVEDELREFGADEVIISTLPPGRSNWLEAGILQRLREELDVPITHVIVDQEIERS